MFYLFKCVLPYSDIFLNCWMPSYYLIIEVQISTLVFIKSNICHYSLKCLVFFLVRFLPLFINYSISSYDFLALTPPMFSGSLKVFSSSLKIQTQVFTRHNRTEYVITVITLRTVLCTVSISQCFKSTLSLKYINFSNSFYLTLKFVIQFNIFTYSSSLCLYTCTLFFFFHYLVLMRIEH